jgi:hypothetical protein
VGDGRDVPAKKWSASNANHRLSKAILVVMRMNFPIF